MKPHVLVIGASGHAKVVIDIIEKEGKYSIAGLIDHALPKGQIFFNYEVIGKDEDLDVLIQGDAIKGCIVAIGDNFIREKVVKKLINIKKDITFISAIHPSAQIGRNVKIGVGSVIMAGAIINSDSSIGDFTIINTKVSIDHDNIIGDFSSIAPGATLGGNVRVGNWSTVSLGVNVIHGIKIGNCSLVGAGSLVLKNVNDNCVSFGHPSIEKRSFNSGDKYL